MKGTVFTRKRLRIGKRVTSLAVVAAMLAQSAVPLQAKEAEGYITLPVAEMPKEIQDADTFYIGTTSADIAENSRKPYLLQIGRGGAAEKEASVVLKISDATAGYGKDYKIRLHDFESILEGKTEADNPEGNQSLLDIISENDVIEDLQLTDEEKEQAEQENMDNLQQGAEEYADSLSGETQTDDVATGDSKTDDAATGDSKTDDAATGETQTGDTAAENTKADDAAAAENDGWAEEASDSEKEKETATENGSTADNPLARAKEVLTGIKSDREAVTSTKQSMVDALSNTGDYLTQLVPGATLKVDFAAGEKTKYVEIVPLDNDVSDGGRTFYITLSEPSEGMTNSAVSESIFTIQDDEPQEDAIVSFAAAEYTAEADSSSVEVVLQRTGAMTQMVSVHMMSEAGSAVSGQDFAPVNADVVFPFGIQERKLKIAVDARYLEQDGDFTLVLTDGSGAKAGEISRARVVIPAGAKAEAATQTVKTAKTAKTGEKEEVTAQVSLSDTRYGNAIDMSAAAWRVRGDGGSVNFSGVYLKSHVDNEWQDIAIALSGDKKNATRQYIYDGFSIRWKKSSGKPCCSEVNLTFYKQNETSDNRILYSSGDRPRFDWETREYRFGSTEAASVKIYDRNWVKVYKSSDLEIDALKPILRPFKVELVPADKLTYLTGDGDKKAENGNAVASTLLDSSGGYAVKYAGDKMVIKQDNALLGISRLAGVDIVNKNGRASTRIDSKYLNGFKKGDTQIQVSLDNDFCTRYASYIDYAGNGDNGSMLGNIRLKPVYEYIDSKLTVNRNTETDGSGRTVDCKVQINGKEVSYGSTQTYHMGDRLTLTSAISGSDYAATGIELSFKNNKTGRNETNQYGYNQGKYVIDGLSRESYTATPMFMENNNRIVVRVRESDIKNFKATGIFDASYLKQYGEKSGSYYNIEVVSTEKMKNQEGASFTLAAEAADGYIPIWQETNSDRYYMGTSFEYVAKARRTANIVFLYASRATGNYAAVKGKIYYENLALNNLTAAGEAILPAEGGYLSAGGQFAIADADGTVQTPAFALPGTISGGNGTVTLSSGNKLYMRVLAGAAGAVQYQDICVNASGTKADVADASGTVRSAYLTDVSTMTIAGNSGDSTRFSGVFIKNKNFPTDTAYMNDEVTDITVNINEVSGEKVKAVDFLIYDRFTNRVKHTIAARQNGSGWTGTYTFKSDGSEDTLYSEGDRIYVQLTTDKEAQLLSNVDEQGNPVAADNELTADAKESLKQTVYAPVNTGYTLVKSGLYAEPTQQALNIGSLNGLGGIPLVDKFNTDLNLGPVSLSIENLYDDQQAVCGQRLKVALGLDFDKTSFGSANRDLSDNNKDYGVSPVTLLSDFGKVKESFRQVKSDIGDMKNLGKSGLASMGASKWGVYPSIGFYLDFAMAYTKDSAGQILDSRFVLQGGGIYLGASANFSVAWYALIPVVFIPCYFGVAGELSLALQAGGVTQVKDETEEITVDDFSGTSHNLSETLKFDFQFSAAGQIQVYCGVGICGTLGVRGGLEIGAGFTWYPTLHRMYSYFDEVGFTLDVGFKMWIDLLVFTIPIPVYSIPTQNYGLNKQYEQLEGKDEDEVNQEIGNDVKAARAEAPQQADAQDGQEIEYRLKERGNDPAWSGSMNGVSPDEVMTMATYKEENTHTILTDGYDRPDSQMIDMGENGTLLVFLQDDQSRTDAERTAVSYSVYKNGNYSTPVIIQNDGTADYQPSVTDAGDDILITWVSSDPQDTERRADAEDYENKYLKSQEVYLARVSKTDLAAGAQINASQITRLTKDVYYDSNPVAVYDEKTGDINVYCVKTAENDNVKAEAADLANPMNASNSTYSVIAYSVYDGKAGKWALNDYMDNEKPDDVTEEAYKAQLQALNGQRILTSPIQTGDINMDDPLIADFTAIGYNGIAVFAYTIDKDNSADTDEDRDLFLQLYDFEERITYHPIRITNDTLADSMPQLVRRGGDTDGTTYLFWKSGDTLDYIDVSSLVKYGIDDNGQIRQSALEQPEEASSDTPDGSGDDYYNTEQENDKMEEETYAFQICQVDAYGADENQYASYSQYRVAVDADDNIYVIWVDNGDPTGQTSSQEIYAAAMIESQMTQGDEKNRENTMKGWSAPNKLTNFAKYTDEPALAITKDNKMLMVYNKYDITENANGDPKASSMELSSSILEPYGSVEATKISVSDTTPVAGQTVDVTVRFENTGLTVAKDGFTAEIYEKTADGARNLVDTCRYKESLIATGIVNETFTYTANEKTAGSVIEVSVTENNLEGTNVSQSEPFVKEAVYEITQNNAYEGADSGFYSDVLLTNTGNAPSAAGDMLQVVFAGPYADAASYGIDHEILAQEAVELDAGESVTFTLKLDVPAEAFRYYGKIDAKAQVAGSDGTAYDGALTDTIYLSQPAGLQINEGDELELTTGETKDLTFQYTTSSQLLDVVPAYASDDETVIRIENGKAVAVGEGTAIVTAYAYPYNTSASLKVRVKDALPNVPTVPGGTVTGPVGGDDGKTDDGKEDDEKQDDEKDDNEKDDSSTQTTKPQQAKVGGVASTAKNSVTISWEEVEGADGYEIVYASDKHFKNDLVRRKTKKTTVTLKKLSEKKTWYVKVRAYTKKDGKTYAGAYSKTFTVKLSARPATVKKATVKAGAKKLKVAFTRVTGASGYKITVSTDKAGKKAVVSKRTKKGSVMFTKLKRKTTYYVTVRSYKKTKNGSYLYGTKKVIKIKTK